MFDRRLLILYGSETGTARDVAESFWCDARRRPHLQCRLFAADDYPIINLIDESLVLFVTSTTGQGELPSNMRQFWRFIRRRSLVADALASMTFAVVGIGDASYQKFNFAAKKVHRRLAMLGGQILMRCALADEQNAGGIEAELDGWRREFWQLIDARMAIDVDEILPDSQPLEPKYCVEWIDDNRMVRSDDRTTKKYCRVTVAENRRVTADDHFQV
jgi:sulfite reductase alpha subunit-like flavoprotein